jgi:acyl carrier protein
MLMFGIDKNKKELEEEISELKMRKKDIELEKNLADYGFNSIGLAELAKELREYYEDGMKILNYITDKIFT